MLKQTGQPVAEFRGHRYYGAGVIDFIKAKLEGGFRIAAYGREGFTMVAHIRGLPPMRTPR